MVAAGQPISSPELVGRDDELHLLTDLFEAAQEGRGAAVLVTGEAGVGKTRLVEEAAQLAADRGFRRLDGAGVHVIGGDFAYGPVVSVVSQIIKDVGVDRIVDLAGPGAADLVPVAPDLPAVVPTEDGTPQRRFATEAHMLAAFCSLLHNYSRRGPVILILEDLHWADRSMLVAMPWLLRELRGTRLAIIGTYRRDELPEGHPTRRIVAELTRSRLVTRIDLRPLSRDDQAKQLLGILGARPPKALVDHVYRRAEGNPFFAEELVARGAVGDLDVPEGLRELLLSRLDTMPTDVWRVLRSVAVAGPQVSDSLLASIVGMDVDDLAAALRTASDHHLLIVRPNGYGFRHELLREAVAGTLLPAEAKRLHTAAATALSESPEAATDGNPEARIAHHWHAAGEPRRAMPASLAAARRAAEMYGFSEALQQYQLLIRLWSEIDDPESLVGTSHAEVLREAAEIGHLAGSPDIAVDFLGKAAAEVDPDADPVLAGLLSERLGRYLWMASDGQSAIEAYSRAVELVPETPPSPERARVLAGMGQAYMLTSRPDEARDFCERAIDMARSVGALDIEGHASDSLGVVRAWCGDVDEGIQLLESARQLTEAGQGDPDEVARAVTNLGIVLFLAGRWEEAALTLLEGVGLIDELGLRRRKGVWVRASAAHALIRLGRWEPAQTLIEEAFDLDPEGIDLLALRWRYGLLRLLRGDVDTARTNLRAAMESSPRVVDPQVHGPMAAAFVELAAWDGDPESGLSVAEETWARIRDQDSGQFATGLCSAAARCAADAALRGGTAGQTGTDADAGRWLERSMVAADRTALRLVADADAATTKAEASRIDGKGAEESWTAAIEAWERLGDRFRIAYARYRLAEALCAARGARARAAEIAKEARRVAAELGAELLVVEIDALGRRARLDLSAKAEESPQTDLFGLTAREQEILKLLAEGWTNRRIGDRLFISPRTVETHVSNVLAKLGAESRLEAAAIAQRHGLGGEPASD